MNARSPQARTPRDHSRDARATQARGAPQPSLRAAWWLLALAAAVPLALWPAAGRAQDRADLDRTQILGNRELPKVLYIVPWKKPLQGNMGGRAVTGVVEEALAPIDRDVLRRQVSYDAQIRAGVSPGLLQGAAAPKAAPATAAPAAASPARPAAPITSPVPLATPLSTPLSSPAPAAPAAAPK
jgi:hypothetical protein